MQAPQHHGSGAALAASARRRRKVFASAADATARLQSKPPFNRFVPAAMDAYVQHDMVQRDGALPAPHSERAVVHVLKILRLSTLCWWRHQAVRRRNVQANLSGQLHLRCSVEEQVFKDVVHLAMDATTNLHQAQCPIVFASGPPMPDAPGFAALLPDAALKLAGRCQDCAHMVMPNGSHFMPFCLPSELAADVCRALCRSGDQELRRHVRWLAVELQSEANGLRSMQTIEARSRL